MYLKQAHALNANLLSQSKSVSIESYHGNEPKLQEMFSLLLIPYHNTVCGCSNYLSEAKEEQE